MTGHLMAFTLFRHGHMDIGNLAKERAVHRLKGQLYTAVPRSLDM